jgi:large subunit ribosomal protein L29e
MRSETGEDVKSKRRQCLQWRCVWTRSHHAIYIQLERRQHKKSRMQYIPATLSMANHEFRTPVDNLIDTHTYIYLHTNPSHFLFTCLSKPQQKNTCAHNNTHKAHANGIKKKKRTKYVSTKGMDPKFLRNQKFSKKYNKGGRQAAE